MTDSQRTREELDRQRNELLELYAATRAHTEALAGALSPEDQQLQSMPDASPTKWHRAHTTWFFEAFVLEPQGVAAVDARYARLFNSYYEAVGPRHPRAARGLLSRPTALEVAAYRQQVDERVQHLFRTADAAALARVGPILELGVAHEEQHQELILTDILHAFAQNPLQPAYRPVKAPAPRTADATPPRFVAFEGGLCEIGASAGAGFAFDNEQPRHKRWLEPFAIADRLVTVRELKAFLDEGGYRKASLWLSDGFDFVRAHGLTSPLYTTYADGTLEAFTLEGARALGDEEPASHLSYYEADALARFLGARLPTEFEWEVAARSHARSSVLRQTFTDRWQWTSSAYEPYPGYRPPPGALGEYNGKFMVSQVVLRGGSCLTPHRHTRATYRNFWPPQTRFQMTGLRLARGAS